jgi:PAS domain S-box-containing protein
MQPLLENKFAASSEHQCFFDKIHFSVPKNDQPDLREFLLFSKQSLAFLLPNIFHLRGRVTPVHPILQAAPRAKMVRRRRGDLMTSKILIVEDEPIVALDLQQELEQFGCEVVALTQSADEALIAAEEFQPDLALMDLHIVGSLDGIQTARLIREAYQVPSVFLTAYSDDATIARAVREMPYGYLTKPFQTRELKATIEVALHKARVDAGLRNSHGRMTSTVDGMHEALLTVSLSGNIQIVNAAAENLIGYSRDHAAGRHLREVLDLRDTRNEPIPLPSLHGLRCPVEEFGLSLNHPGGASIIVDMAISPSSDNAGVQTGYVITLRRADERVRSQAIEDVFNSSDLFELAPMAMVQLDTGGHVVRVNQALLRESGVAKESLVGRTLTGLRMDPDPRIAGKLMQGLLEGSTTVTTAKPLFTN